MLLQYSQLNSHDRYVVTFCLIVSTLWCYLLNEWKNGQCNEVILSNLRCIREFTEHVWISDKWKQPIIKFFESISRYKRSIVRNIAMIFYVFMPFFNLFLVILKPQCGKFCPCTLATSINSYGYKKNYNVIFCPKR